MKFKEAFAAARRAGKKEFSWNGKKYNTKLKNEGKSNGTPKKAPTPTARPANSTSSSKSKLPDTAPIPTAKSTTTAKANSTSSSKAQKIMTPSRPAPKAKMDAPSAKNAKSPSKDMSEMDRFRNQFTDSGRRVNAAYDTNKKK